MMTWMLLLLAIIFLAIAILTTQRAKERRKQFTPSKAEQHRLEVFDKLYHDVDGMTISLKEREKIHTEDTSFTYGEITPLSFAHILKVTQPEPHEVFYDLGCGTGKAVIAASLFYHWKKCTGIELLPGLFKTCEIVRDRLFHLSELATYFPGKKFNVQFRQENILQADISDANVIFMHATTFGPTLWQDLMEKLKTLKSGTRFITVTKQLDEDFFEKIDERILLMTWGESTAFIYRRK